MPQRGELETTRRGRSSRERGERNRISGVEGSCGNAQTSFEVAPCSGRSNSRRGEAARAGTFSGRLALAVAHCENDTTETLDRPVRVGRPQICMAERRCRDEGEKTRATVLTRECVREDVPTSAERAGGFRPAGERCTGWEL